MAFEMNVPIYFLLYFIRAMQGVAKGSFQNKKDDCTHQGSET